MKELLKRYKMQLLLITYGILTVKIFYGQLGTGLDLSWAYALNKLTVFDNIKFGRDLVFTYGPLGFLAYPMYLNGNFFISVIIYGFLWISILFLFYKLIKSGYLNIYIILFSLIIMYLGCPADGADLYVQYSVLMALAVLWKNMEDKYTAVFLVFMTTVSFFFKFSIRIAIIGAYLMFLISKLILKETKRIWILFLPCITIPICYLLYNPSILDFFRFIKGSWEISQGFNSAMSTSQNDQYVFWLFVMMIIYIAIMISQLIFKKERNFFCMLWLAPCLFMSYKHGYVRADGHCIGAYIEILAIFSIGILLFDFKDIYAEIIQKSLKGMVQGGLILALLIITFIDYNINIQPWINLRSRIQNISSAFYFMTEKQYEENVDLLTGIPDIIFDKIGDSTFTSYPWEITFIEKSRENEDGTTKNIASNFIPLFALQMYSAYTPYLDNKTASVFYGMDAPEYIIFKLDTIDGRIPLMEAPSTWKSIEDNYEIVLYDFSTGYYLFKHKENITSRIGKSESVDFNKDDIITFNGCSEAKIYTDLSLGGKLTNLIWKIPEVKAKVKYTDGTVREGRILMDNLSNGITVSGMPYSYDTLYNAMFSDGVNCTIDSMELSGDGLKYYEDIITIEYIYYDESKEVDFSYLQADLNLSKLEKGNPDDVKWKLDVKILDPLNLQGWAYLTDKNINYNIYIKIDGVYYSVTKKDGEDVVKNHGLSGNSNVRFRIDLPIKLEEPIQLILVTDTDYYEINM